MFGMAVANSIGNKIRALSDAPAPDPLLERAMKAIVEADTMLRVAMNCAGKLRASVSRLEIYQAAEYGWLVNQHEAMREWCNNARAFRAAIEGREP